MWCMRRSTPPQGPLRETRRKYGDDKRHRLPYKQRVSNPDKPANEPKTAGGRSTQVNKTELIERIAEESGVPTSEAQKHFEAFERVVTEALKSGEEVRITGFGKFSVRERKAREGRNPQTGEKIKIAAQRVPAFSAGNALKEAV
jgi:DNA-binding protein HU-beta